MSNVNDFVIEDGVLKKYIGSDPVVVLPNLVVSIDSNSFSESSAVSVALPKSVQHIEGCGFAGSKALECIILSEFLETIGIAAFKRTNLKSVHIPDSVKAIEAFTFEQCKGLRDITIGKSIKKIGIRAFYNCVSLENIYFNGTIEEFCKISRADSWDSGTGDYIIRCTDGEITKYCRVKYY